MELVHTEDCGQVPINIIDLSDTEDLGTVMTCNEVFNPEKPDTFGEAMREIGRKADG